MFLLLTILTPGKLHKVQGTILPFSTDSFLPPCERTTKGGIFGEMNFFSTSSFIVSVIVLRIVLLRCLLVLHPLQHHPIHFGHRKQSSILLQCNLSESEREESQELPEGRKERINEGQTDTSSWCHYLARKSYSLLN